MVDTIRQSDEGGAVPRPGILVANRYMVLRALGAGGMGAVVAAHDSEADRLVAIKFLLPSSAEDERIVVRFDREARATERLRSEHVRRALDVGVDARGRRYLVMEYLEGEDLRALVKREGPIDPARAARYVSEACHGLAEAHALGVVHRDLKPANLFLARRLDGSTVIKVVDFGVAKFDSPNVAGDTLDMTESQMVLGSRHFMAPEQILSPRSVDALADVWALGGILYYLLTGKTPFAAPTLEEMTLNMLCEPPHPILSLRPDLPAYLVDIVSRCLERDRKKRFPNVVELLRALNLDPEPEVAEPRDGRASLIRTLNLGNIRFPPPPFPPPPPSSQIVVQVAPALAAPPPLPESRRMPGVIAIMAVAVTGAAIAIAVHAMRPVATASSIPAPKARVTAHVEIPVLATHLIPDLPDAVDAQAPAVTADVRTSPAPGVTADFPASLAPSKGTRIAPARAQIAVAPKALTAPAEPVPTAPPVPTITKAVPAKNRMFDVEN